MSWRVALIDSCGVWPGAVAAAAFVDESAVVAEETATRGSGAAVGFAGGGVDADVSRGVGVRMVQRRATGVDATGQWSRWRGCCRRVVRRSS